MAVVALLMCLAMLPFAGALVFLPIAAAAWSYRRLRTRSTEQSG